MRIIKLLFLFCLGISLILWPTHAQSPSKPPPGVMFNYAHPLNPLAVHRNFAPNGLIIPFNEGSGSPRIYIAPIINTTVSTGSTERLATLTGAQWNPLPGANYTTSKWSGPSIAFTTINDTIDLGVVGDFMPLEDVTIVCGFRKRDTTLRGGTLFAVDTGTSTRVCKAFVPFTDGVVYWQFGGTAGNNQLAASGLTFGDDVWVFSAGKEGMEIWQNGRLCASSTVAVALAAVTDNFFIGHRTAETTDLVDIAFFYVYPWQLSPDEILQISNNPFCFYEWGEDIFEGSPVVAPKKGDFFSPLIPPLQGLLRFLRY